MTERDDRSAPPQTRHYYAERRQMPPDRPGDRAGERSEPVRPSDQQQAAALVDAPRTGLAEWSKAASREQLIVRVAAALADARADEAARRDKLVTGLRALAFRIEREGGIPDPYEIAEGIRAVLDADRD